MIEKRGSSYVLLSRSTDRVLGTHPSYGAAMRQERAIQARKHARANPVTFVSASRGRLLGYKVMDYDPVRREAVSMAGRRIRLPVRRGAVHTMPGKGIFLGASARYVLDYYAGNEFNVLLTYAFDPADVTSGCLTDREPEITVSRARLVGVAIYDENGHELTTETELSQRSRR